MAMNYCKNCYRSDDRKVPVEQEETIAGHRAFRCRWCGNVSGEAIANDDRILNIGTLPADRWSDKLRLSEL
jgi:hypothetical protein